MAEKFSYSKIETFDKCPYKYDLVYRKKHFVNDKSIALEFGTLIHFIEESMGKKISELGNDFSYLFDINPFIDMFININDSENKVYGMKKLKEKYPEAFNEKDKNGLDYTDKGNLYLNKGIFRLYNFLVENPTLEIIGLEKEFNLPYSNYIFHGFIDRVFRDKVSGDIFIEDIKTYSSPLEHSDLTTPLQFVFYTLAAKDLFNVSEDKISCAYEIPLCDIKQEAGTKGFMSRGTKKINILLAGIEAGEMEPKPSPLCHWCVFSETFQNQPEEAKNLCPYYCKWTRENKDFSNENEWMGIEAHTTILENYCKKPKPTTFKVYNNLDLQPVIEINSERRFLLRR